MAAQFGDLVASVLHCPRCRQAQPVRERLLLILPDGELHEYLCRRCGTPLAQRRVTTPPATFNPPTAPARRAAPPPLNLLPCPRPSPRPRPPTEPRGRA